MTADLPETPWQVAHWRDIDYTCRYRPKGDFFLEVEVFRVSYWEYYTRDGVLHQTPSYEREDAHSSLDTTGDLDRAECTLRGDIKWDGCADIAWNTAQVMWHGCDLDDIERLNAALRRTYLLAAATIPEWDPDLAGTDGVDLGSPTVLPGELAPETLGA